MKKVNILLVLIALCVGIYIGLFIGRTDQRQGVSAPGVSQDAQAFSLDLNTATAEQLQAIDGIEAQTALAIVNYRREYGEFLAVRELLEVEGIDAQLYDRIKDYFIIGGTS